MPLQQLLQQKETNEVSRIVLYIIVVLLQVSGRRHQGGVDRQGCITRMEAVGEGKGEGEVGVGSVAVGDREMGAVGGGRGEGVGSGGRRHSGEATAAAGGRKSSGGEVK